MRAPTDNVTDYQLGFAVIGKEHVLIPVISERTRLDLLAAHKRPNLIHFDKLWFDALDFGVQ